MVLEVEVQAGDGVVVEAWMGQTMKKPIVETDCCSCRALLLLARRLAFHRHWQRADAAGSNLNIVYSPVAASTIRSLSRMKHRNIAVSCASAAMQQRYPPLPSPALSTDMISGTAHERPGHRTSLAHIVCCLPRGVFDRMRRVLALAGSCCARRCTSGSRRSVGSACQWHKSRRSDRI